MLSCKTYEWLERSRGKKAATVLLLTLRLLVEAGFVAAALPALRRFEAGEAFSWSFAPLRGGRSFLLGDASLLPSRLFSAGNGVNERGHGAQSPVPVALSDR